MSHASLKLMIDRILSTCTVTDGYVKFMDLTVPTFLGTKYEWVMSLEVGEHIPSIHEATFLRNIVRHATEGVVLSWGVPGQHGHHHVNLHENSYVISRMADLGFVYDNNTSEGLRKAAQLEWFKNTIMVFRTLVNKKR